MQKKPLTFSQRRDFSKAKMEYVSLGHPELGEGKGAKFDKVPIPKPHKPEEVSIATTSPIESFTAVIVS